MPGEAKECQADGGRRIEDWYTQIFVHDVCRGGKCQTVLLKEGLLTDLCKITPKILQQQINAHILPSLNTNKQNVSLTWARQCLVFMGYRNKRHVKGIYYDGHERKDVVKWREAYIKEMRDTAP